MKVRRSLGMFVAAVMSLSLVAACDVPLPDDRDSAPRVSPSPTPEPTDTSAPPSPTPEEPTEESPEPEETPGETPSEGEPTPSPDPSDPTPTPTQDPSPTPTPTADPSPTPTPTPTPDPAPEPEPKPDPAPAPDSGSTDARGFTVIPTSSDTRKVYVSSSSGSDNNDCLSEAKPCKSIGEGVKKIRPGHADHLYLKAGDVWVNDNGLLALRGGRSLTEPTVITSYGEGARPRLEAHGSYRMLAFNTGGRIVNDLWFIGLHIQNSNLVAGHPTFTGEAKNSSMFLGGHSNILLEDNIFDHHEVIFQNWEGKNPTNIKVRRNIFTGAYTNTSSYSQNKRPSNMYLDGVNGLLLEENVFDSGGWHPTAKGAGANMYNHNIYVQYSQLGDTHVVRDNLFTRASSHGIQMRSGGLAENNFFGRNAIGLLLGYGTQKPLKDARIRAFDNVITEGHSMIKGHDHCQGNNLCTAALWGLDINIPADKKFEADRNIVHSRSKADDSASLDRYPRGLSAASLRIRDKSTDPSKTSIEGLKSIILWRWNNNSEDFGPGNYPDPGRTLGDYYEHLRSTGALDQIVKNGTVDKVRKDKDDFVSFLNLAMNRAPGEWDDRIAAPAVNDYIRAGFGW